jgi:NADH dehydrogenase FAD-containing subunit
MYAALSAARLRDIRGVSPEELQIALVAPEPTLVVRPRLYEPKPETLTAPLLDVLKAIDVAYVQGSAETIDTKSRTVGIVAAKGAKKSLSYDRLVVATGSRLFRPNIPGLTEHGFSVDSLDDAIALDKHLHSLAKRPAVNGRDTVVVAGGGFTGIEAATEMPSHCAKSSARMPSRASSSSTATRRSHPIWAKAPVLSSRRPCASSAWKRGSAPVSRRSTNPASRFPAANASRPRP